jgi:hypothetical protein
MVVPTFAAASTARLDTPGQAGSVQAPKLAYSHQWGIVMPAASVKPRYDRVREHCLEDTTLHCTILSASINLHADESDALPTAMLSVRLPHAAIAPFEQALLALLPSEAAGDASIESRWTTAEDLSSRITDVERRLKQLTDYRERLTALLQRQDAKVEDLVKVEGELSQTQNQIETLAAQQRNLDERVETEVLTVNFLARSPYENDGFGPVAAAWHKSASLIGMSAGNALRYSIMAVPWLPVAFVGALLLLMIVKLFRRPD